MKQLKRFALACLLVASLSAVAMADQMDTPPGETNAPPGQMDTPPAATSTIDVVAVEGALVALLG